MNYSQENEKIIIDCGKYLTLESAPIQKNLLLEVLSKNKSIILQAHELNHIDCAGLQLLLYFSFAAKAKQITWEWLEPSPVLIQSARLLAMQDLLHLSAT